MDDLANYWIAEANWQAQSFHDRRKEFESDDDAAWSGFENLRTMLQDGIDNGQLLFANWEIDYIEIAYKDKAKKLFGVDYIRGQ